MESPLVDAARTWVIECYPWNRVHLLKALEWLDRVAPDSPEAIRLATLTHDMERAFPGPDQPIVKTLSDPEYERLHSDRSARIVGAWLRERQADEALVAEVERLIVAHEFGGWPEADAALFESLRKNLRKGIPVHEMDCHINDAPFATAMAQELLAMCSSVRAR